MADEVQQHILGAVVATAADQLQNSHPRLLPRLKSMAHSENRSTCGTGGAAQSNWNRGLTHVNCFSPGSFTWIRKRGIASRGHSGFVGCQTTQVTRTLSRLSVRPINGGS